MSYCLNPACPKPHNPADAKFCITCGARLLLGDRYRALKSISQGGIGRTFLAIDEGNNNQSYCIIKQFSFKNQGTKNPKRAAELFRQEVIRLQELGTHPQLPQLLAYFEPEHRLGLKIPAIVQTYIDGESLAHQLATEGAFSETQIRQLLIDILPVLQFIHDCQIIHRDINPDNLIHRYSDNQLVLVDFGAAKFTTKTILAKTGTIIGSAAYAAPEQLRGKAFASSDLYSLGLTCIHLLTNIHPFDLFSSLEGIWVWQDYLNQPVSSQLCRILNKMLASAIRTRYHSGAQILYDLNPTINVTTNVQLSTVAERIPLKSLTPSWRCTRTLTGHLSSINAIALSPQETILASGSADRKIRLWYFDATTESSIFSGHLSLVEALAFSPDGQRLVSGSWDHSIKVWSLETSKLLYSICHHSGWIKSLVISPDGQTVISGSADRTIKIWELNDGNLQKTFSGHSGAINALALSPNGQLIASGSADNTIKIWQLSNGEIKFTLDAHLSAVNSLVFSPSGQILISGSADQTIKIWNLNNNEPERVYPVLLQTLKGHGDAITSIALNSQGNMLISGSVDGTIKVWHPSSGKLLHTLTEHSAGVTAVAISPNSTMIASGSQDKTIKLWQFE